MKIRHKIAFIGYGMYAGGAEANAIHIADYFLKKGVQCDFISIKNNNDYEKQYRNFFKKIHNYHLIIEPIDSQKIVLKIWLSIKGIVRFFSILHREKYDMYFSVVEYHPSLLTIFGGLISGKKTILTIHDNLREDLLRRPYFDRIFYRIILDISLAGASHIICVSHGLKEQMISFFRIDKRKLSVIHNGVDTTRIQKMQKSERLQGIPKIIILSRLVEKKNHLLALEAIHEVSKTVKISCEIIGKGLMEDSLREFVSSMDMDSIVRFRGFVEGDPYRYLRRANLFLFTSKYEGFGNAIVEAMACGLPIISSNCEYGPLEILSKTPHDYAVSKKEVRFAEYGVLVNITGDNSVDSVRFGKAISKLLRDKKMLRQYGERSLVRSRYFSVEKMCHSYYKLISPLF